MKSFYFSLINYYAWLAVKIRLPILYSAAHHAEFNRIELVSNLKD